MSPLNETLTSRELIASSARALAVRGDTAAVSQGQRGSYFAVWASCHDVFSSH